MYKKLIITAAICAALVSASASVYAEGTFLCMKPDETIAISADENKNFKYLEMTASNGQTVFPQISTDGNTYLPFRYVCEMAGLKDGAQIQGPLPDGYFRYWGADPSIPGDKQKIEIQYDGQYYCHNIGESFTYKAGENDYRTVSIYNIKGNLYFPMRYIALITNSQALWHWDTEEIIYISNSLNSSDYIDERGELRRDKKLYLEFDFFANNLGNSPLYLSSDGKTIKNLSSEIEGSPNVKSITRSGQTVYFIDSENRINTKSEFSDTISAITFTDPDNNILDITAASAVVIKNKLYGIHSSDGKYGRLFESNLDGSDFVYLNNKTVYNLNIKHYRGKYYLFYCDAATKSDLHMIELKTMDDYEIEVTDFAHNNLLNDINQFIIGDKTIAYLDTSNTLHIIDTEDNLEEFEILRLNPDAHKIYLTGSDGENLDNVTSMNYDYINNVLYVSQVDYTGRTYYYTKSAKNFERLERSEHPITDIALFSDVFYNDYFAKTVNKQPQIDKVKYADGKISIIY